MSVYIYIILIIIGILLWFIPYYRKGSTSFLIEKQYFFIVIIISFISGFLLKDKWYISPIMINIGQLLYLILIYATQHPGLDSMLLSFCYLILQTMFMLIPAYIGYLFS